ncbi:hypothetical protein BN439_3502 [Erwinia amylovora Ea644]|uniref:hypothetical protein n=1 Tax=Erwinia amylovora TaxID=552 RepID=UPI0002CBBFA6|nr:hypothetical protein BN439_3502 [Erwinia amylovora Ea644]CCP08589.1 hypothetical protein BN440_3599 [Erwinia amylovora MR1]
MRAGREFLHAKLTMDYYGGYMSFIETVKYVRQLSVIDEFGGRGNAGEISEFYIIFRATDGNGTDLSVSKNDVEEAVLNNYIVISNYIGDAQYSLGLLERNPNNDHFIVSKIDYKFNSNVITLSVRDFKGYASISVKFKNANKVFASTCYLSGNPSCFFLSRKP